jgi:hypothetical protein
MVSGRVPDSASAAGAVGGGSGFRACFCVSIDAAISLERRWLSRLSESGSHFGLLGCRARDCFSRIAIVHDRRYGRVRCLCSPTWVKQF